MNRFIFSAALSALVFIGRVDVIFAANPSLVIITSAQSTIGDLSRMEVIDIYMGRYKSLKNGEHVTPIDYTPDAIPPLRGLFYKTLVNRSEKAIRLYWSRLVFSARAQPPQAVTSPEDMLKRVTANQNVLGYIDERMVSSSVKVVYRLNESPKPASH